MIWGIARVAHRRGALLQVPAALQPAHRSRAPEEPDRELEFAAKMVLNYLKGKD
jgi:hypothetical protein